MTKDREPYELFRNNPPPRRNHNIGLSMLLMGVFTIMLVIIVAFYTKSNGTLPSVVADSEDMVITSIVYEIRPCDTVGVAFLYFQDGHCIRILSGLTMVLIDHSGTFHFTKVNGYYDLWRLESVEYW